MVRLTKASLRQRGYEFDRPVKKKKKKQKQKKSSKASQERKIAMWQNELDKGLDHLFE